MGQGTNPFGKGVERLLAGAMVDDERLRPCEPNSLHQPVLIVVGREIKMSNFATDIDMNRLESSINELLHLDRPTTLDLKQLLRG